MCIFAVQINRRKRLKWEIGKMGKWGVEFKTGTCRGRFSASLSVVYHANIKITWKIIYVLQMQDIFIQILIIVKIFRLFLPKSAVPRKFFLGESCCLCSRSWKSAPIFPENGTVFLYPVCMDSGSACGQRRNVQFIRKLMCRSWEIRNPDFSAVPL